MHTHTIVSAHALSTIGEICAHAAKIGLKAVAITDHGPMTPDSPHLWYFSSIRGLPREVDGVYLLRGAEANVLDTYGSIDVPVAYDLDYVIASMHNDVYRPSTSARHTETWLAICDNPYVDCLGHTGQPDFPFDHEEVVKRCRDTNTLIEINNASKYVRKGSWESCAKILRMCKKHETRIVVSSDAHNHWGVGNFSNSAELLDEVGFPEELVVNADWERFKAYFGIEK